MALHGRIAGQGPLGLLQVTLKARRWIEHSPSNGQTGKVKPSPTAEANRYSNKNGAIDDSRLAGDRNPAG